MKKSLRIGVVLSTLLTAFVLSPTARAYTSGAWYDGAVFSGIGPGYAFSDYTHSYWGGYLQDGGYYKPIYLAMNPQGYAVAVYGDTQLGYDGTWGSVLHSYRALPGNGSYSTLVGYGAAGFCTYVARGRTVRNGQYGDWSSVTLYLCGYPT